MKEIAMKNILLLSVVSVFPFLCFAQQISISEEIPIYNDLSYELIGELKGQTLLFRNKNYSFEIQGFNKQLHLSWKREIQLDKKNPKPLGICTSQKDFTLFYQFKHKGRLRLKAHKYDPGANLRDSVTLKAFDYMTYSPSFNIIRSKDNSKVLIYYLQRQEEYTAICFAVDSMKVLWEKSFTPEKSYRERLFQQILVTNDGTMFFILKKNNFSSRTKKHLYRMYYYNGEDEIQDFSIPMEGKLTYDAWFSYDDLNKRLIAGGLFAERNTEKALGYFYLNVNPYKPADVLLHFENLELEFISKFMDSKPRKSLSITDTELRANVIRRDGGILLFAERVKEFSREPSGISSRRAGDYHTNTDMYHDNIMVLSIHPTGKLHWKNILYKKQYSQNDDGIFSSYFLFKTKGNLRLLFNDEIKSENTVSEYVLDGRGEADRNSVMNTEDLEIHLRFQDAIQLDAKRILVPSERRSHLKLVRFEFE